MEELKTIKNFPNYMISNLGYVYSCITNKKLNGTKDKNGYVIVGLYNNGKQTKKKIHRLVAEAFIPNPDNLPQVNHKDENTSNNNVENLEWCDSSYNINYGTRNDRAADSIKKCKFKNRRKVVCLTTDNMLVKIYPSMRSVENDGFRYDSVSSACKHRKGTKIHKGYKWLYYDEWVSM